GSAKKTFEEAIKPYQRQIAELNRLLAEAQAKQQQPARDEIAALRQTVVTLQRQLAEAQAKRPPAQDVVIEAKLREIRQLQSENASLRGVEKALRADIARLRRQQPKPSPRQWSESEQVTELQRQLKAAKTRIKNLTFEANDAWAKAKANPASIS